MKIAIKCVLNNIESGVNCFYQIESICEKNQCVLVNKIEAHSCHNDYKTIESGCMSGTIGQLNS